MLGDILFNVSLALITSAVLCCMFDVGVAALIGAVGFAALLGCEIIDKRERRNINNNEQK